MLISVIIPMYNSRQYLERLLNSFEKQEKNLAEWIFVDDGSEDESLAYVKEKTASWTDPVKLIRRENGGIGAARNSGAEEACGDYLLFIDSDDEISEKALAVLSGRQKENPEATVIQFGVDVYCEGKILETEGVTEARLQTASEHIKDVLSKRNASYIMCNKLIKREIWQRFQFVEKRIYEDMHASIFIACLAQSVYQIPDRLYKYHLRANSTFTTVRIKQITDYLYVIRSVLERLDEYKKEQTESNFREDLLLYLTYAAKRVTRVYKRFLSNEESNRSEYHNQFEEAYLEANEFISEELLKLARQSF